MYSTHLAEIEALALCTLVSMEMERERGGGGHNYHDVQINGATKSENSWLLT